MRPPSEMTTRGSEEVHWVDELLVVAPWPTHEVLKPNQMSCWPTHE